jgi:hypothetical protein
MFRTALAFLVLVAAAAAFADDPTTGFPDLWIEAATSDPQPMSLFCVPDGSGRPFAEAFAFGGFTADATIELLLLDAWPPNGVPIVQFPGEDLWLQGSLGNLAACFGGAGAVADHDTDADGRTWWRLPLEAGGRIDPDAGEVLQVVMNGDAVGTGLVHGVVPTNLRMNSADLNGDGLVNLSDAGLFAGDLGGPYAYRSDFVWDGAVNLSDAGLMALALGRNCP